MSEAVSWKDKFVNKVTCGNCLELLKELPDNSVDLVITDPPYFIGFKSSETKGGGRSDWGNHTLLTPLFDTLFKEFKRLLRKDGRIFMFTDWRTYPTLYLSVTKFLSVANLIVWDYGWIKAGTQFRFTHELILHAVRPKAKSPKNRSISDVWRIKPVNFTVERNHPAEKPVDVIKQMIEQTSFNKEDIILDPFLGSGTTAVACKQLGRDFIGVEINPTYVSIAEKRLANVPEKLHNWFKEKECEP